MWKSTPTCKTRRLWTRACTFHYTIWYNGISHLELWILYIDLATFPMEISRKRLLESCLTCVGSLIKLIWIGWSFFSLESWHVNVDLIQVVKSVNWLEMHPFRVFLIQAFRGTGEHLQMVYKLQAWTSLRASVRRCSDCYLADSSPSKIGLHLVIRLRWLWNWSSNSVNVKLSSRAVTTFLDRTS